MVLPMVYELSIATGAQGAQPTMPAGNENVIATVLRTIVPPSKKSETLAKGRHAMSKCHSEVKVTLAGTRNLLRHSERIKRPKNTFLQQSSRYNNDYTMTLYNT